MWGKHCYIRCPPDAPDSGTPREKTMSSNVEQPTAKIYQFPVRRSAQCAESLEAARVRAALAMPRAAAAALGSAWYHEAAVHEDERKLGH